MFCTTLRRRPSFASLIPTLKAPPLALRESQLGTHALEIRFGAAVDPSTGNTLSTRCLRVLAISPGGLHEARLDDTIQRIQHFAALTGGEDIVIVFLLNPTPPTNFASARDLSTQSSHGRSSTDGARAYAKLQAEMINHPEIPHVPILPVAKSDMIQQQLQRHVATLARTITQPKPSDTSLDLLRHCTVNPPMAQETAYVLSDTFPSLASLAAACSSVNSTANSSSPSARIAGVSSQTTDLDGIGLVMSTQESDVSAAGKLKALRDLVGDQDCRDIVDFWKEEWTID